MKIISKTIRYFPELCVGICHHILGHVVTLELASSKTVTLLLIMAKAIFIFAENFLYNFSRKLLRISHDLSLC